MSLGSDPDGASVISSASPGDYMFVGGVRPHYDTPSISNVNSSVEPENLASLVTLEEQINPNDANLGETFATGIAAQVSAPILASCTGRAGYRADQLSFHASQIWVDFNHFQNTCAAAAAGSDLIRATEYTYKLGPLVFKQGESDGAVSTSASDWKDELREMLNDFRATLAGSTLTDTSELSMMIDQQAMGQSGCTYHELAVAALELHKESEGIVCVGPTYALEYTDTNDVHLTSNGYRNYGEKLGQVIGAIESGAGWEPCHITAAVRVGTVITLDVHVPFPACGRYDHCDSGW